MHGPTYLLALHDFQPCFNNPDEHASNDEILNVKRNKELKKFGLDKAGPLIGWT